jgi:SAM-dependent methyltransferase
VHRRNARRVLRHVEPAWATGARLLDVGCGYGFLLDEARRAGWTVAGVDVSAHAREEARARFGIEVVPELDHLPDDADGFAAVTAVQVLHHAVDPDVQLNEIAARMRPGGLLALETLDRGAAIARVLGSRWSLPAAPWTVWLFDRPSLTRMLGRRGFSVLDIRVSHKRISLRHLGGAVNARRASPRDGRWSAALGRMGRLAIPYPLTDTILVTARRGAG